MAKLTAKERAANAAAVEAKKAAEKFALWAGEARKNGEACKGSFIAIIKRSQPPTPFGDDGAALAVFNEAVMSGQITQRTIKGISGETLVFKMKDV